MKNNLLKDKYPEIFSEIDIEKTKKKYPNIDINNITCSSNIKAVFFCKTCGNIYEARIHNKTNKKSKCPYCSGKLPIKGVKDLATYCKNNNRQDILDSWDYDKNKDPSEYLPNSTEIVYFKCKLGHIYRQRISDKINKKLNCPICSNRKLLSGYNDLETFCKNNPEYKFILDEWNYSKNIKKPNEVFRSSHEKFWFKCEKNHSFKQDLHHRTSIIPRRCPYCSNKKSAAELTIYNICKKYIDETCESGKIINGWEIDVYMPKYLYCIEYDGAFYHNSDISKDRELRKNTMLLQNGHKIIRIKETKDPNNIKKFKENLDGVIIYYVRDNFNNKYFVRVSEIIKDLFNININYIEIREIYRKIKNNP